MRKEKEYLTNFAENKRYSYWVGFPINAVCHKTVISWTINHQNRIVAALF